MFKKLLVLITVLAPLSAWAEIPITGRYISPDRTNDLNIDTDGSGYTVNLSKNDASSTCEFSAVFDVDPNVDGKLFGKLHGCYITVLVNGGWASITANGPGCDKFCSVGSLDTQGLRHH